MVANFGWGMLAALQARGPIDPGETNEKPSAAGWLGGAPLGSYLVASGRRRVAPGGAGARENALAREANP